MHQEVAVRHAPSDQLKGDAPTVERARPGHDTLIDDAGPPQDDRDGLRRHPLVSNDLRIPVPGGHRLADHPHVMAADLEYEASIVGMATPLDI